QLAVVARRLDFALLERRQQRLDAVERCQHEIDRDLGHRQLAVADLAEHALRGMRHAFEAGQPEEAAGSLDGVDDAEDAAEQLGIIGILLKLDELAVQHREALIRLGQEFAEQIVHGRSLASSRRASAATRGPGDWPKKCRKNFKKQLAMTVVNQPLGEAPQSGAA